MQLYMLYVYNIFENSREERIRLYVLIYLFKPYRLLDIHNIHLLEMSPHQLLIHV